METIDSTDCASLLRCTPEQVEELARSGEIPGIKIGRSWLFVRADLLSYLAEKARNEARERREKRLAGAAQPQPIRINPRRQTPPKLMTA